MLDTPDAGLRLPLRSPLCSQSRLPLRAAFCPPLRCWMALGLAVLAGTASAQSVLQPAPQNVVSLSAQASIDVPQDMLTIWLGITRDGSEAAAVQSQLRQALDAALTEARKAVRAGQLEVRTGGFSLFPRYANKPGAAPTITGWQGQAELVLEGRDIGAISQLAGRLPGVTVSRVQPGLSREARERAEAEVASSAIARFKTRAETYARQFGYAGYSLREVAVGGGDVSAPNPVPMLRMARASVAGGDEAQPVAPGQATVTVTVNGSVQLSPR